MIHEGSLHCLRPHLHEREGGMSMSLVEKADVLIIGAGIMGASCAFRLSEQGVKVVILEAQKAPALDTISFKHT
jgi:heterodisulfide reductase subunit A-like polyferredoxin